MIRWPLFPASTIFLLLFLALSFLPPSSSADSGNGTGNYQPYVVCSSPAVFTCGTFSMNLSYPFSAAGHADYCSHPGYHLFCTGDTAMINISGKPFRVKSVNYSNTTLTLVDPTYDSQSCPQPAANTTLNFTLFYFSQNNQQAVIFMNCTSANASATMRRIPCLQDAYCTFDETTLPAGARCGRMVEVGMNEAALTDMLLGLVSFGEALARGFTVGWKAGAGRCADCVNWGGVCGFDNGTSYGDACFCPYGLASDGCPPPLPQGQKSKKGAAIAIGVAVGVVGFGIASFLLYMLYRSSRKKEELHDPSSPNLSLIRSPKSIYHEDSTLAAQESFHPYRIPIFTYEELDEATNGFSVCQELGDGGFSAVYKGKLRDGRIVAVKRFFENHSRHAEQFRNEVGILSQLRHPNLVTMYGSSTFHGRILLLVYEYVSNGTVEDHLCGSRAFMAWPIRMRIAIEIADALSYLHAIEPQIIHRDVKTSNILLDDNFHVKLSDFGLSRPFPLNAIHVKTAPLGTPGYVDPDYQKSFQLTEKSDVYSFGVVLAELISSKPAFDLERPQDEVYLANLALKRIRNHELDEFVDPGLGYQSDMKTTRMIDLVADLTLRCLQEETSSRPDMKEVLEVLRVLNGDETLKMEKKSGAS